MQENPIATTPEHAGTMVVCARNAGALSLCSSVLSRYAGNVHDYSGAAGLPHLPISQASICHPMTTFRQEVLLEQQHCRCTPHNLP